MNILCIMIASNGLHLKLNYPLNSKVEVLVHYLNLPNLTASTSLFQSWIIHH